MGFLSSIFYIFVALLVLLFMITVHELGHYLAGKALGFKINQFSIGFGKALFSRTSKKTGEKFAIRLIPLGGFCEFEGEDESGNVNPQAFNNQKPWKRIIVLLAGAFFNFVVSILIVILVMLFAGMYFPSVDKTYSQSLVDLDGNVNKYVVNENDLLQKDDIIIEVGGNFLYLNGDLTKELSKYEVGKPIEVTIVRDGVRQQVTCYKGYFTAPDADGKQVTYVGLGIGQGFKSYHLPFFETIGKSFVYSFKIAWTILSFFGQLITGQIGFKGIGGPVATIGLTAEVARSGFRNLIDIVALIGINLAVFNVLPFPALDGARVVFVGIEWVRKKPIKREIEAKIHMFGLIILFSFVIVADIFYMLL